MEMIDTHSHLFTEDFTEDISEVLKRAREAGVGRIYMPNIDSSSVSDMLRVCQMSDGLCFPMIGLHPTSVSGGYRAELADLKRQLDKPNHPFVAIGEVGLDFYWDIRFKEEQIDAFRQQIEWALEYSLPIVIHCRSAIDEMIEILKDYKGTPLKGIFHSFSGTALEASRLLRFKGFMFGINGTLTFKRSTLAEDLINANVPLSRLVLETDSPYLAPVPCRGKRNESSFLIHIVERLASVYGKDVKNVIKVTTNNARKVFENT